MRNGDRPFRFSLLFFTLFCAAAVFAGCESSASGPDPAPGTGLEVVLSVSKGTPPQQWQYQVSLVNNDSRSHDIVLPGDGSLDHWRTPCIGWSFIDANDPMVAHPDTTPLNLYLRCGNVNPLNADEIVTLRPGESRDLGGWSYDWFLLNADTTGSFSVVFYYENIPDMEWYGVPLGNHDPVAVAKVRNSTPFKGRSNAVIVTY